MPQHNRCLKARNSASLASKALFACALAIGFGGSGPAIVALGDTETQRPRASVELLKSQTDPLSDDNVSQLLKIDDNARVNGATRRHAFSLALKRASSAEARQAVLELLRRYPLFAKSTPQRKRVLGITYPRQFLERTDEYWAALPSDSMKTALPTIYWE